MLLRFFFCQIGAGHGKFTCLVLQHLLEMREFLPSLCQGEHANGVIPDKRGGGGSEKCETDVTPEGGLGAAGKGAANRLPFRYIMTDVAQVHSRRVPTIFAVF